MDFEIAEEHRMLKDLVANFVRDELMPLEPEVLATEARGGGLTIGPAKFAAHQQRNDHDQGHTQKHPCRAFRHHLPSPASREIRF